MDFRIYSKKEIDIEKTRIADKVNESPSAKKAFVVGADVVRSEHLFVAIEGKEKFVGLVGLRRDLVGLTLFIFVEAEYQGRGLGRKLLESLIYNLSGSARSAKNVYLTTYDNGDYQAAIRLYRQYDFKVIARVANKVLMTKTPTILTWLRQAEFVIREYTVYFLWKNGKFLRKEVK